jgi:glycosyltransferase involved in cell wall biosynthesis
MDGIPVVLMEAMAIGTPVISTKISGIPELVQKNAGILVSSVDATVLADAIEKAFYMENNEKIHLLENARKIIQNEFNIQKETEKLALNFYQSSNKSEVV